MSSLSVASRDWHALQRQEMVRVGRSLFERGYVHASAGNLSVRVPRAHGGGVLITPTDACLGFLQADDAVWLADDDRPLSPGRASKTVRLHRRIYAADPEAGAVIHTHSTHLVGLTLQPAADPQADLLPPITPYFVMKVGHVPRVSYHRPGDPAAAEAVGQRIEAARARGQRLHAVMLDRLGPNVWHSSLAQAMAVLEELEETARLWCLFGPRPTAPVQPLGEAQIDELRQHFGASW
jgi:ribulose-5-phosphate 4-epimerase/fuculose-1-phosphate aldolase